MNEPSLPTTYEVQPPAPEITKGEQEYQAFLRLLPSRLATHRGQHVAIHDGQVVDSDTDDIRLIRRVHAKIGYVPIFVGFVTEELPAARIPHYREYRPRSTA